MGPSRSTALTAEIVSAYVGANRLDASELPALIAVVHAAMAGLGAPSVPVEEPQRATAAQIKKSLSDNHLISFEDGRPYKSLKRHLGTRGLTPDQYREKWGLRADYPMVAPGYAKTRSELAKRLGLGRFPKKDEASAKIKAKSAPRMKKSNQTVDVS